jgi:hypothetical protein
MSGSFLILLRSDVMNTLWLDINLETASIAIGMLTSQRNVNNPASRVSCNSACCII